MKRKVKQKRGRSERSISVSHCQIHLRSLKEAGLQKTKTSATRLWVIIDVFVGQAGLKMVMVVMMTIRQQHPFIHSVTITVHPLYSRHFQALCCEHSCTQDKQKSLLSETSHSGREMQSTQIPKKYLMSSRK